MTVQAEFTLVERLSRAARITGAMMPTTNNRPRELRYRGLKDKRLLEKPE